MAKHDRTNPAEKATPAPADPALQMLLAEMEALARILPPAGLKAPGESDEAEDAFFDNMPV